MIRKLVLAAATIAAALAVSSPALAAQPCGAGWRIVGRDGQLWVCENIDTGVRRLVGG